MITSAEFGSVVSTVLELVALTGDYAPDRCMFMPKRFCSVILIP